MTGAQHWSPRTRRPLGRGLDLMSVPVVGRFLGWKHGRTAMQTVMLLLAVAVILDGLFGPPLAPQNLAGVLPWVHWRGFVVLALLVAGNLFCMACPFMLPRRLAKRMMPANHSWPTWMPGKWLAVALLLFFFWAYEAFDIWASPWLTAWVAIVYFVLAFVIDGFFKGAAFCKYVCPIGQFHFVNSMVSPLEIKVRAPSICATCTTKDCISGRRNPISGQTIQNGCELWLFQERKVGNMDCTFCLDCIHACPHDNVGILLRNPAVEFASEGPRSGLGKLSQRYDISVMILVLVFGAYVNAFGMVRPIYQLEQWLASVLPTSSHHVLLAIIFVSGIVVLPVVVVSLVAWISQLLAGDRKGAIRGATEYCISLVPLGFAMWVAHYGFHFLTGGLAIVPVTQNLLLDLGIAGFGEPRWDMAALLPGYAIDVFKLVAMELGLLGSLFAGYLVGRRKYLSSRMARRALIPWAFLFFTLFALGVWLLSLPMEMRGTGMVGS